MRLRANDIRISHFKNLLDEIARYSNRYKTNLENNLDTSSTTPYSDLEYNTIFNDLENQETLANKALSKLSEFIKQIEDTMDVTRDYLSTIDKTKQAVNNRKFRSGLKGQIKLDIIRQPNGEEIIESLPEGVKEEVENPEFILTPYEKKGGKSNKRNKKNKQRTHKRRK